MNAVQTDAAIDAVTHAEVSKDIWGAIPSCSPNCNTCVEYKQRRILTALKKRKLNLAGNGKYSLLNYSHDFTEFSLPTGPLTDYDYKALCSDNALKNPVSMQAMFISPSQDPKGEDRLPVPGFEFMVNTFISSATGSFYTFQQVFDAVRAVWPPYKGYTYTFDYITQAHGVDQLAKLY